MDFRLFTLRFVLDLQFSVPLIELFHFLFSLTSSVLRLPLLILSVVKVSITVPKLS